MIKPISTRRCYHWRYNNSSWCDKNSIDGSGAVDMEFIPIFAA